MAVQKTSARKVEHQELHQWPRGQPVEKFLLVKAPLVKILGEECLP